MVDELIPSKKYEFSFNTQKVKGFNGSVLQDSIMKYTMYSQSRNKFGTLTFKVMNDEGNIRYHLYKYDKPFEIYKKGPLQNNRKNTITNIEGGIYKLELYRDVNSNKILDYGSFKPYIFSEPIKFIKDSIPIRSNWDRVLKDITFD